MRDPRPLLWMTRLAAVGVLAWPALSSSAQTRVVTDAETLDTGRAQTVVVTQRPLRTFRGETVRIGRYAESEKEIGVVRPLRRVPGVSGYDYRDTVRRSYDSHGRSTRLYVDSYNAYPRYEKEIGVVRPYVTYNPPVRYAPQTFTNPNAPGNAPDPGNASAPRTSARDLSLAPVLSEDVNVTAVETVDVPVAHRDDPWALLNHGYYREARQQFALLGTIDDITTRTGHALAAALSGDLAGGVALMPANPALPEGAILRDATVQRLSQIGEYLYADQPAMQAKIKAVLDAGRTAEVTAQ